MPRMDKEANDRAYEAAMDMWRATSGQAGKVAFQVSGRAAYRAYEASMDMWQATGETRGACGVFTKSAPLRPLPSARRCIFTPALVAGYRTTPPACCYCVAHAKAEERRRRRRPGRRS